MLTAATLLQQAIRLLTRSPLTTLTVLMPALIMMSAVGIIAAFATPGILLASPAGPILNSIESGLKAAGVIAAFILSYAAMAILWHRHTLRDTCTISPISFALLRGYVWRVLALALIQLAASLALVTPLVLFSNSVNGGTGTPSPSSIIFSTFIIQLTLIWLSLRLSLILPSAALGKPISMAESWQQTKAMSRTLWSVAAVLAAVNTCFAGLTSLLAPTSPPQRLLIEMPVLIFEGLLIFSVLTTLYTCTTPNQKSALPQ